MISWGTILYGAGLSVVFAAVALVLIGRERSFRLLAPALVATFAGPVAWQRLGVVDDLGHRLHPAGRRLG